jgi:hypothetical protein
VRGGALGPQLLPVGLRHPRIVRDVVLGGRQHVGGAAVYLLVVVERVLDLLHIHRLVVLVQQLYLVLSQKQYDLVLNMLLPKGL